MRRGQRRPALSAYFTYFTNTFSILPLNLNGAWS